MRTAYQLAQTGLDRYTAQQIADAIENNGLENASLEATVYWLNVQRSAEGTRKAVERLKDSARLGWELDEEISPEYKALLDAEAEGDPDPEGVVTTQSLHEVWNENLGRFVEAKSLGSAEGFAALARFWNETWCAWGDAPYNPDIPAELPAFKSLDELVEFYTLYRPSAPDAGHPAAVLKAYMDAMAEQWHREEDEIENLAVKGSSRSGNWGHGGGVGGVGNPGGSQPMGRDINPRGGGILGVLGRTRKPESDPNPPRIRKSEGEGKTERGVFATETRYWNQQDTTQLARTVLEKHGYSDTPQAGDYAVGLKFEEGLGGILVNQGKVESVDTDAGTIRLALLTDDGKPEGTVIDWKIGGEMYGMMPIHDALSVREADETIGNWHADLAEEKAGREALTEPTISRHVDDVINIESADKQFRAQAQSVIDMVSSVHGIDQRMNSVPVYYEPTHEAQQAGATHIDDGGHDTSARIVIANNLEMAEDVVQATLVHEMGHAFDLMALDVTGQGGRALWQQDGIDLKPLIAEWKNAIGKSAYVRMLEQNKGRSDLNEQGRQIVDYLTQPAELWARAYAQYIAKKSGNRLILDYFAQNTPNYIQGTGEDVAPTQWDDADFTAIEHTMDNILEAVGWKQQAQQEDIFKAWRVTLAGTLKGGAGSGHYGHAGRPGERGGSAPSGTGTAVFADKPALAIPAGKRAATDDDKAAYRQRLTQAARAMDIDALGVIGQEIYENFGNGSSLMDEWFETQLSVRKAEAKRIVVGIINAGFGSDSGYKVRNTASQDGNFGEAYLTDDRGRTIAVLQVDHDRKKNILHLEYLKVNPGYTSHGIAEKVLRGITVQAEKMGIEKVALLADISVGKYAWARYGFDLRGAKYTDKLDETTDALLGWVEYKGFAQRGDKTWQKIENAVRQTTSMFDLSGLDVPGVRVPAYRITASDFEHGENEEVRLGKAFLLDTDGFGVWDGEISVPALKDFLDKIEAGKGKKKGTKSLNSQKSGELSSVKGGQGSGHFGHGGGVGGAGNPGGSQSDGGGISASREPAIEKPARPQAQATPNMQRSLTMMPDDARKMIGEQARERGIVPFKEVNTAGYGMKPTVPKGAPIYTIEPSRHGYEMIQVGRFDGIGQEHNGALLFDPNYPSGLRWYYPEDTYVGTGEPDAGIMTARAFQDLIQNLDLEKERGKDELASVTGKIDTLVAEMSGGETGALAESDRSVEQMWTTTTATPSVKPEDATRVQQSRDAAMATILSVHDVSEDFQSIPFEVFNRYDLTNYVPGGGNPLGFVEQDYDTQGVPYAVRMGISDTVDNLETTIIHEFGHALDFNLLHVTADRGKVAPEKRPAGSTAAVQKWMQAVAGSEWVKAVRDRYVKEGAERVYLAGREQADALPGGADYMMQPNELWARSYTQYIAMRSGRTDLIKEVSAQSPAQSVDFQPNRNFQWDDADFAPIGAAVEEILRAYGLLNMPESVKAFFIAWREAIKGGAGSGNAGHRGRPGKRGGSLPRSAGTASTAAKEPAIEKAEPKGLTERTWRMDDTLGMTELDALYRLDYEARDMGLTPLHEYKDTFKEKYLYGMQLDAEGGYGSDIVNLGRIEAYNREYAGILFYVGEPDEKKEKVAVYEGEWYYISDKPLDGILTGEEYKQLLANLKEERKQDAIDRPVQRDLRKVASNRVRDPATKADVNRALDLIQSVHGVDAGIERFNVNASATYSLGVMRLKTPDQKFGLGVVKDIGVNPLDDTRVSTFIHEFGHAIDHSILGVSADRDKLQPELLIPGMDEAVEQWKQAVAESKVVKAFGTATWVADRTGMGRTQKQFVSATGVVHKMPPEHFQYVTSTVELWARSYAQYIADTTRDRDAAIEIAAHAVEGVYQWKSDDFAPIGKAIENILRTAGWMNDQQPASKSLLTKSGELSSVKGGRGSGNHGHAGRPGKRGGSAKRGAGTNTVTSASKEPAIENPARIRTDRGADKWTRTMQVTRGLEGYDAIQQAGDYALMVGMTPAPENVGDRMYRIRHNALVGADLVFDDFTVTEIEKDEHGETISWTIDSGKGKVDQFVSDPLGRGERALLQADWFASADLHKNMAGVPVYDEWRRMVRDAEQAQALEIAARKRIEKAQITRDLRDIVDVTAAPPDNPYLKPLPAAAEYGLDAIAKVHGVDQRIMSIPLRYDQRTNPYGQFYPRPNQYTTRAYEMGDYITLYYGAERNGTAAETFVHEFGHFIDWTGLSLTGKSHSLPRTMEQSKAIADWKFAISGSKLIKGLYQAKAHPRHKDDRIVTVGDDEFEVSEAHRRYLTQEHEIWARAYSQWIALRSGDKELQRQIATKQVGIPRTGESKAATQWADDDFAPIATAIDEIFRAFGWT